MGLELTPLEFYNNGGGVDRKSADTKVLETDASDTLNMDYSIDGSFITRNGSTIENAGHQMAGPFKTKLEWDYRKSTGLQQDIIANGTTIYRNNTNPVSMVTGRSLANYPDFEQFTTPDDEFLFYGDGEFTNLKYDGVTWTNWSIAAPITLTLNSQPAGALTGEFDYYVAYGRTIAGVVVQYSDLSPQLITNPVAQDNVLNLPVSPDPQVNARIIYRKSPTSLGHYYQLAIVFNNTATTYTDSSVADTSVIDAQFDNQAAPVTKIFESYLGSGTTERMYIVDNDNKTDLYWSKPELPWAVPTENLFIADAEITCLVRCYGALIIGTTRSLWVLVGDIETNAPRRISSLYGILNNRCADGEALLYFMSTNRRMYRLSPTDFSQTEMRMESYLSWKVEPIFATIAGNNSDLVCLKYYKKQNVGKVCISIPSGSTLTNNTLMVFNEDQSNKMQSPCWEIWDNIFSSSLTIFNVDGDLRLTGGDFNGFIWFLDNPALFGDGVEVNGTTTSSTINTLTELEIAGTATSATNNTLTDTSLTMGSNQYVVSYISITGGTGSGQSRQIIQNTVDTFTVDSNWGVNPDNTSTFTVGRFNPGLLVGMRVMITDGSGSNQVRTITANTNITITVNLNWNIIPPDGSGYTVGGYNVVHGSNWKGLGNYDFLKQLWFIWINSNASGNYNIQLIVQTDFNKSLAQQQTFLLNLSAANTIWGNFIWGQADWGDFSAFQDRLRIFARFRSIRVYFKNNLAGQPFQINGYGIDTQNKGLFFRSAA